MTFRVIVTGFNCERWASACLTSIVEAFSQHDVYLYAVDDGSTDTTHEAILNYIASTDFRWRFSVIKNAVNMGAAFARWQAIEYMREHAADTDIIVFVDLDDLIKPHALDIIADKYAGGAQMTYGNWVDLETGVINDLQYYPEHIIASKRWGDIPFYATAARTSLWALAKQLTPRQFIYEDKWLHTCTDVALMFALFDIVYFQSVATITDPIYVYRQNTGNNSLLRFGYAEKIRVSHLINARRNANNSYHSA